jgi:4-amino-4-deoxy-L-arabinose transferase-like glycosyltransferase
MLMSLKDKFKQLFSVFSFQFNTTPNKLETWQYILMGVFIYFACFYGISYYAILDMNEGLYSEVAREMLANKHFIIPTLNNVPYLEKPPLFYWLIAASYKIFGVDAFSARIIPSLFMGLTGLSVLYVGYREQTLRTGFIATIILLSSIIFVIIGRTVFFDMTLSFFIAASLFSFYFWTKEKKIFDLYLFYLFLGLAILTKGFLALVLVGLIVIVHLFLTQEDKSIYKQLLNKNALILFLVITVPWHIMAIITLPQFFWEYFINNQVLRFFNMRVPHDFHTGPIYFYLPRVIAYLLPWTIFLPAILWPIHLKRPWKNTLTVLLFTWFLVMLIFFSLSGNKGDYYLVVGTVPLAYLIAQKIENWLMEGQSKFLSLGFYLFSILFVSISVVALLFYTSQGIHDPAELSGAKIPFVLTGSILTLALVMAIYTVGGFYLLRKSGNSAITAFLLIAGFCIPLEMFYLNLRENTETKYSQISLAKYVQAQYQHRIVYFYEDFEALSSFVFYNKESAVIIDSKSEDLYFGQHYKKQEINYFISLKDFLAQSDKTSVYVVVKKDKLKAFQNAIGDKYQSIFCVVQSGGNVDLLSNAAEDCRANLDSVLEGSQKNGSLLEMKKNTPSV